MRAPNTFLSDINRIRDGVKVNIHDLERWRTNILNAIHQGYAETPEGEKIQLNNSKGIDHLANMIEASILSPNRDFYGNLHNSGHVLIGVSGHHKDFLRLLTFQKSQFHFYFTQYAHDPEQKFLESFAVMGSSETGKWNIILQSIKT